MMLGRSNLIVTGFMGVGKSTLGPLFARRLQYSFIDLDDRIVENEGLSVVDIFEKKGLEYFRSVESQVLEAVLCESHQVVSLGGGAILSEKNRSLMDKAGHLLCLSASVETLAHRLKEDLKRPLFKNRDNGNFWLDLYKKRKKIYDGVSWQLSTDDKSLNQCVEEMFLQWKSRKSEFV